MFKKLNTKIVAKDIIAGVITEKDKRDIIFKENDNYKNLMIVESVEKA